MRISGNEGIQGAEPGKPVGKVTAEPGALGVFESGARPASGAALSSGSAISEKKPARESGGKTKTAPPARAGTRRRMNSSWWPSKRTRRSPPRWGRAR